MLWEVTSMLAVDPGTDANLCSLVREATEISMNKTITYTYIQ